MAVIRLRLLWPVPHLKLEDFVVGARFYAPYCHLSVIKQYNLTRAAPHA